MPALQGLQRWHFKENNLFHMLKRKESGIIDMEFFFPAFFDRPFG